MRFDVNEGFPSATNRAAKVSNGKLLLLGLYTPDLVLTQLPTTLPSLTFFQLYESDTAQEYNLKIKLNHLESGEALLEATGGVSFAQPGVSYLPMKLGGVQFKTAGAYVFSVEADGQEPFLTQFSVILQIPERA